MKYLYLFLICTVALLLTGCWDSNELDDLAIVTAASLDQAEDDQIELSIQVYNPQVTSTVGAGEGGGGGDSITKIISAVGDNPADALSKLQTKVSRRIFLGQCKVYIFSEEVAKKGVYDHMDMLLRHPFTRERANLFVSEGDAKRILELDAYLERYGGETLRKLAELEIGMEITVKELDEMLTSKINEASLPYVIASAATGEGEGETQASRIFGTAIFKADKMVGKLTEAETRGLLWIRDEIRDYTVTIKMGGGTVSLNPVSARINLRPEIVGGMPKITIEVETEGTILENSSQFDFSNPKEVYALEEKYRERIRERLHSTLTRLKEINADVVGFGESIHRTYPQKWKELEPRWEEIFPEIDVQLDINAHVRRMGNISNRDYLRKDELN
jgi:spore germination protein KC